MTLVGSFDVAGLALCIAGAVLLVRRWPRGRQGVLAAVLLGWATLHALGNTLEWTGLAPMLERYENHLQVIAPVFWGSILYILLLQSEMDRRKRTETKLAQSEERLSLAVDGAPWACGTGASETTSCISIPTGPTRWATTSNNCRPSK